MNMTPQAKENRSLTRSLWVMVVGSFAFGFALVPLYDVICEAAGIRVNAKPSAIQASNAGVGREITLDFMSMIPDGSAFELVPETRSMKLQPGRLYEAKFLIKSRATVPVTGQAIPERRAVDDGEVPAEDGMLLLHADVQQCVPKPIASPAIANVMQRDREDRDEEHERRSPGAGSR